MKNPLVMSIVSVPVGYPFFFIQMGTGMCMKFRDGNGDHFLIPVRFEDGYDSKILIPVYQYIYIFNNI